MRGREIKERGGRGGGGGGGESERKREREGTEGDRERMKRWTVARAVNSHLRVVLDHVGVDLKIFLGHFLLQPTEKETHMYM